MTTEEFYEARDLGWDRGEFHGDPMVGEDIDEFEERIAPIALQDAIAAFPNDDAEELSDAVREGIRAYYNHVFKED